MKLKRATINKYLKEPYPFYYSNKQRLVLMLLFISVLSFSFSYFFEPFTVNITEHKINYIWILLIQAFTPLPIAYLYLTLINKSLKDDTNWTLGKEILNLSVILLLIGIVGFLMRDVIYTNHNNWSLKYFWEEIRNTFLVGLLLLVIVLPLNLERLINKHRSSFKKLASGKIMQESNNIIVSIKKNEANDNFELNIKDFLFAKVESNYIEIFTFSSDGIDKILIRKTLKELEEQLKPFSYIFKTHRSYLVNLNAIESISGNAQGYQLLLKKHSVTIPVSRSNIKDFNKRYSNS